jgi:hypothetical protein
MQRTDSALRRGFVVLMLAVAISAPEARRAPTIGNGRISIVFGDRGITTITDISIGRVFKLKEDGFRLVIDGKTIDSATLGRPRQTAAQGRVVYDWNAGGFEISVTYEIEPAWRFVSKQIAIVKAPAATFRVGEVHVFRDELLEPIASRYVPASVRPALGTSDYGVFLRFTDARGLLAAVQNPFLQTEASGGSFVVRYSPDMEWRPAYGPFVADRGMLAPYRETGRVLPARMPPEWARPSAEPIPPGMDEAEVAAFTDLVHAFLLYRPTRPLNLMVGWCVNDYQIDVASADGRSEYKRVVDRAAELGAQFLLYAPSNTALSRREASLDDWSWEHVLWLGLGQKIRSGAWDVKTGEIPPSVREMVDYAKSKNVKLLAYVYPVVPFSQNPEWLVSPKGTPDKKYASLGVRSLQDWLIDALVTFHQRTGIGGYAFDHTFLAYEGTSRYAQWAGWRRVMEEVRRRVPDIVIDGRQAYQLYGPWSWLAGSYPHPTFNDEQPESFVPFPDLHVDRVSADRQRYTAYRYRMYDFAPNEIVPGFITHQTPRNDESGRMPESRTEDRGNVLLPLGARDWDYLGWRYSLLSSIATGGWNNVLNMIPARDEEEAARFSEDDRRSFRAWIDWTQENKDYLRHTRPILGPPALGRIDGTSAIVSNRGFIFLFNPNGRRLNAELSLDDSIGLNARGAFVLKELFPLRGRLVGKPDAGGWASGDRVSIPIDGGSAVVLELQPATATTEPVLFNAPGTVSLDGDTLAIAGARGEVGSSTDLFVQLPAGRTPAAATVNGHAVGITSRSAAGVTVRTTFDGVPFRHYQSVVDVEEGFPGGKIAGTFTIPKRIVEQLAARRKAWPIPWTPEDFRTTWLVPERLLLFVQIAEPDARWDARLTIDGRTIELRKAYSAIRSAARTFVGFYADLSMLDADRRYSFELDLPKLAPGQLQGVFFENVETEYTDRIAAALPPSSEAAASQTRTARSSF